MRLVVPLLLTDIAEGPERNSEAKECKSDALSDTEIRLARAYYGELSNRGRHAVSQPGANDIINTTMATKNHLPPSSSTPNRFNLGTTKMTIKWQN